MDAKIATIEMRVNNMAIRSGCGICGKAHNDSELGAWLFVGYSPLCIPCAKEHAPAILRACNEINNTAELKDMEPGEFFGAVDKRVTEYKEIDKELDALFGDDIGDKYEGAGAGEPLRPVYCELQAIQYILNNKQPEPETVAEMKAASLKLLEEVTEALNEVVKTVARF